MWGFFEKLKKGLSKTHQGFVEQMDRLFLGKKTIDGDLLNELEALLFSADLGVKTSSQLIEGVQQGLKRGDLREPEKIKDFIKEEILRILRSGEKPLSSRLRTAKCIMISGPHVMTMELTGSVFILSKSVVTTPVACFQLSSGVALSTVSER